MEGNRDEAEKCIGIAREALEAGNRDRALRFLGKAQKLYPTETARGEARPPPRSPGPAAGPAGGRAQGGPAGRGERDRPRAGPGLRRARGSAGKEAGVCPGAALGAGASPRQGITLASGAAEEGVTSPRPGPAPGLHSPSSPQPSIKARPHRPGLAPINIRTSQAPGRDRPGWLLFCHCESPLSNSSQ